MSREVALPLPVALLLSVASGGVYAAAFPAPNVWVLAFPAVAGMLLALRGRRLAAAFLVGLVGGLAFWFTLIDWVSLFLGALPLAALGTLEALIMGAGAVLIAMVYRSVPRLWDSPWGRLGLTPLLVAGAWSARETIASTWPYGGFGWGRFALSQSTGPFAPLAAWLGVTGLGFVLAWLTAFGLACLTEPGRPPRPLDAYRRRRIPERLLAIALAAAALLAVPAFPITVTGSMRIAAVQPNSHAGYFDPKNDPAANLEAAVRATLPAAGKQADLVVWPEGAASYDVLNDTGVQRTVDALSELTAAPLLVGSITERDGRTYNSSILRSSRQGVIGVYDKVRPVPFGEYVPDRAFWTPFAPDLLKLIGRDYTPGTRSSVLAVGGIRIGVDICFDIVDDGLLLNSVADGAEVLVGQTNNADFGETEENEQQLAIARMRAIETGRSFVSVSTVASTTAIGPDGRTLAAAKPFRAQTLIADVPTATGITPAVTFGIGLGAAIAILGVALPLVAGVLGPAPRRRRRAGPTR